MIGWFEEANSLRVGSSLAQSDFRLPLASETDLGVLL